MKAPGVRRRSALAVAAAAVLAACGGSGGGFALPVPVFAFPFAGDVPAGDGGPTLTVALFLRPRLPT